MTRFDTQTADEDFAEFRAVIGGHFAAVPASAWGMRTGTRDRDWTLLQALAHLAAIARAFNAAVAAALNGAALTLDGLARRTDLRAWNEAEIAARAGSTPADLIADLLDALDVAAEYTRTLTAAQMERRAHLPVYNRPAHVRDFIDWQLSHAGVIHAAQVTRPLDQAPLWARYSLRLLGRQIERFMRHLSYAYWPEYGEGLHAAINFHIGGEAGGAWHVIAAPDGGDVGTGAVTDAPFALHFTDAGTLFGIFTVHIPMQAALQSGALRVAGDARRALEVIRLFSASPPGK